MTNTNTLYQHGTLALLVPGLLKGTISMSELLQHGDTGIGTGEGLDGEIIILDGTPYQVRHDGSIVVVPGDFALPFASVHTAGFVELTDIGNTSKSELEQWLPERTDWANTFFAATVTGTFSAMHTRAVAKQGRPYPTLEQTAAAQSVFTAKVTKGTLLIYYAPALFNGVAVGGCHIHYLADDHTIGGHALDFHVEHAQVAVQRFDTLEQHLPVENSAFMTHDFSKDDIAGAIATSEN